MPSSSAPLHHGIKHTRALLLNVGLARGTFPALYKHPKRATQGHQPTTRVQPCCRQQKGEASHRAVPETTPLWTLFLIKRSRSLSLCGITCSNVRRHTCSTERERERERGFCLLKGIAEGTYQTKHAEAARPYYTTIHTHTHMHRHDRHASQLELGHARERRCAPNRREQRVVARHEAQQHDGAR